MHIFSGFGARRAACVAGILSFFVLVASVAAEEVQSWTGKRSTAGHVDTLFGERAVIGVTLSLAGGWLAYHLVDRVSMSLEQRSQHYRYRDEILRPLATSTAKLTVIIGAFLFLAGGVRRLRTG